MVKVELESKSLRKEFPRIRESCCLCKRPTRFWHIHKTRDCALCPDCAVDAKTSDIPTKEEWGKQFDEDEKKIRCRLTNGATDTAGRPLHGLPTAVQQTSALDGQIR